jgi:hypothetical protein
VHGVVVTRIDAEGRAHDVTRQAKFSSLNPELLSVDTAGRCEAVADGEAALEVAVGSETALVPVTSTGVATAVPPSFRQDVLPILTKTGCNAGGLSRQACGGRMASAFLYAPLRRNGITTGSRGR